MNGTSNGFPQIEKIINVWAVLLVLCLWIFSIASCLFCVGAETELCGCCFFFTTVNLPYIISQSRNEDFYFLLEEVY